MAAHTVTLQLQTPLYDYFRRRADESRQSLEEELLESVRAVASQAEETLPPELEAELACLKDRGHDLSRLLVETTSSSALRGS